MQSIEFWISYSINFFYLNKAYLRQHTLSPICNVMGGFLADCSRLMKLEGKSKINVESNIAKSTNKN